MSSLVSSCLFAVRSAMVSQGRGCSPGSIPTLGHTYQEAESSMIAGQDMFHCETASTYTLLRQSIRPPSKSQADSIPECRLVQVKTMLSYRQDCSPVGCTLFSSQVDHLLDVIKEFLKEQPGVLCYCLSLLLPDCIRLSHQSLMCCNLPPAEVSSAYQHCFTSQLSLFTSRRWQGQT